MSGRSLSPRDVGKPELLSVARQALAQAETLPELATLVDQAEVIRVAARAAGLSTEAQNDWTRFKVDCEIAGAESIKRLRDAAQQTVGHLLGLAGLRGGSGFHPGFGLVGV